MYTADPGPISGFSIVDPTLAMTVLILGVFIMIVGIVIAGVVYRESREWKKMILPMFDRSPAEMTPESAGESDGLARQKAARNKEIFSRVFGHMDVAGLLGGGATVIMGVLIILIGLTLNG
ncbi:MAG: hypothetical protein E3J24_03820 [Dehalococcoidia bacterium]|nr:MAG: hypothetical protein E3J24_03820 [Dehalococcoidia bacterium]